ncbi:MAG: hypothetical protein ACRDZX_00340 [Acidimicrobiales bacterium]
MTLMKAGTRAALDRFVRHYFDRLADDIHEAQRAAQSAGDETQAARQSVIDEARSVRQSVIDEASGVRQSVIDEAGGVRQSVIDEARSVRQSVIDEAQGTRQAVVGSVTDEAQALRQSVIDEAQGTRQRGDSRFDSLDQLGRLSLEEARNRFEGLERRFGEVEASVVHQLEGQAQRQVELRQAMEEHTATLKQAMEKLELLFMGQLEGLFGAVHGETAELRGDIVELTRMLRMQGDAADQVAEVMGRTLTRLSAEVEILHAVVETLPARPEEASSPA